MKSTQFVHVWVAETVRLREAHHGPFKDQTEVLQALSVKADFTQRLLERAYRIGKREGILDLIEHWSNIARITLLTILVIAIFTGIASALGTLGNGYKPVNVYLTLATILGINTLAFVFWFISLFFSSGDTVSGLARTWLWLTRKVARGPDATLVPQALISVLSRQRALQPLFGTISHALWLCVLIAALAAMAALLSARSYSFQWETTLLSPNTFVWLTSTLGWLPSIFGFSTPTPELILISDGSNSIPTYAHALWSSWLIGCVVVYGVAPRFIALIVTAALSKTRLKSFSIDTQLPGFAELRHRLDPPSLLGQTDGPAPEYKLGKLSSNEKPHLSTGQTSYILALELPNDEPWPPLELTKLVYDLGVVDTREQRRQALQALIQNPAQKLLIVCDSRQTPDRGSINFIQELSQYAHKTNILLLFAYTDTKLDVSNRCKSWVSSLNLIDVTLTNVHLELESAINWLQNLTITSTSITKETP